MICVSACVGTPDDAQGGHEEARRRPEISPSGAAFSSVEARKCVSDLRSANIGFTPLLDQDFGNGCSAKDSVKLLDIGVQVSNLGPITCPLARHFIAWTTYAARPAARKFFRAEIVKIETFGTYSCRTINGASVSRMSQHAYSNAIDVSGFVLDDGRRIMVDGGWRGDEPSRQFFRALHKSACRRFGTTLGPDYNRAHYNHLHLDMSGNGYCR